MWVYSALNSRFRPKSNFSAPMWDSLKLSHYIFPCRLSYLQSRQSTVDVAFVCLWCLEKATTFIYSRFSCALEKNFVFPHRTSSYPKSLKINLGMYYPMEVCPIEISTFAQKNILYVESQNFSVDLRMAWQWESCIEVHVFDTSIRIRSSVHIGTMYEPRLTW